MTLGDSGEVAEAAIALFGVGEGPVLAAGAMGILAGQIPDAALLRACAQHAAADDIDPPSDIHASSEFRRHLVGVLTERALTAAVADAATG